MVNDPLTKEKSFIDRVQQLDNGQLAMLRRNCGKRDPVEGRCPWLIGLIHGVASEATAFLVASLLAQYRTADIRSGHHNLKGDFGLTWKQTIFGKPSDSLKRRFHILLDSYYEPWSGEGDLPYRIRQMVRYAASEGVGVDWPLLLKHLRSWQHPGKWVQKEWARTFFTSKSPEEAQN